MKTLLLFGLYLLVATLLVTLPLLLLVIVTLFLIRVAMRDRHVGAESESRLRLAKQVSRPFVLWAVTLLSLGLVVTLAMGGGLIGYWASVRVALGFLIPRSGGYLFLYFQYIAQLLFFAAVAGLSMRRLERRLAAASQFEEKVPSSSK